MLIMRIAPTIPLQVRLCRTVRINIVRTFLKVKIFSRPSGRRRCQTKIRSLCLAEAGGESQAAPNCRHSASEAALPPGTQNCEFMKPSSATAAAAFSNAAKCKPAAVAAVLTKRPRHGKRDHVWRAGSAIRGKIFPRSNTSLLHAPRMPRSAPAASASRGRRGAFPRAYVRATPTGQTDDHFLSTSLDRIIGRDSLSAYAPAYSS